MAQILDQRLAGILRGLYGDLRQAAADAAAALGEDETKVLQEDDLVKLIEADRRVARIVREIIAVQDR